MEASGNSLSLADFPSNWILISPASSAIQNELDLRIQLPNTKRLSMVPALQIYTKYANVYFKHTN